MRRYGLDPVQVDRIAIDHHRADLDERTVAMLDYAIKITRNSASCTEDDIVALRGHGFSDEDISDIINTAAIYNFNNRVASASGYLPDRANHQAFR